MISFIKYVLMSTGVLAVTVLLLAYMQYDADQDAARTAVYARSL